MTTEPTMADRIMAAAEKYAAETVGEHGYPGPRTDECRAALAALVAEACAPPPERVCRWVNDGVIPWVASCGEWLEMDRTGVVYCPGCGGLVELVYGTEGVGNG